MESPVAVKLLKGNLLLVCLGLCIVPSQVPLYLNSKINGNSIPETCKVPFQFPSKDCEKPIEHEQNRINAKK